MVDINNRKHTGRLFSIFNSFGKRYNGLSTNAGTAINAAATAAGGVAGGFIGGGFDSGGVGDAISGLGDVASAIPGPWGAAIGAGLKVVGGFANRAFGVKLNKENIALVQSNIDALREFNPNAGTWDSLLASLSTMPTSMNFSNKFIGTNGWFNNKADNKANNLRALLGEALSYALNNVSNNIKNITNDRANLMAMNYSAYGGPLHMTGNGVLSPFGARFSNGGELNNPLSSNGIDWNIGLIEVNNGGSHEQNPNEGVLMGVDELGVPNLVEEGEVIWNDYVFSNRLKVPKELREKLKLGHNPITYAEAVKSKKKEREERPNDPIEKRGFEAFLNRLMASQEEQRQKQQERQARREEMYPKRLDLVSPMYDELQQYPELGEIPVDLNMLQLQMMLQQLESPEMLEGYAYGGRLGNIFLGIGPYSNLMNPLRNINLSPWYPGTSGFNGNGWTSWYNNLNSIVLDDFDWGNFNTVINKIKQSNDINQLKAGLNGLAALSNPYISKALNDRIAYLENNKYSKYSDLSKSGMFPSWRDIRGVTPSGVDVLLRRSPVVKVTNNWDNFNNNLTLGKAVKSKNNKDNPLDTTTSDWLKSLYNHNATYGDYDRLLGYIYGDKIPNLYKTDPNRLIEDAGLAANSNLRTSLVNAYGEPILGSDKKLTYYTDEAGNRVPNYNIGDFRRNVLNNSVEYENSANTTPLRGLINPDKLTIPRNKLGVDVSRIQRDSGDEGGGWIDGILPNLRYVPAIGNAISVFSDLMGWTNKPDYTNANAVLEASKGVRNVKSKPIGDYLTYRPLDRMYYLNLLSGQANAMNRNIMNTSGGNRGAAMAGLLAANYNAGNNMGNLARLAEEYDNANREQVANFNRETNKFNSLMDLEAQRANLGASEVRLNAALNAARLRDTIDARIGAAKSANLTNFFDSIGDIGREEFTRNMINSNRGLYYTIGRDGVIHYKPSFDKLSEWEKRYWREQARIDANTMWGNTSRGSKSSYGGYLTIKRRR